MPNVRYPDSVPVDEPAGPIGRPKPIRRLTPATPPVRGKARPVQYPDSVPVDEPVSPMPRPAMGGAPASQFKKGGKIDGIAQRGKTRGKMC